MTVSYQYQISSSSSWAFLKLIFRWRGSIWKSVLSELCTWTALFYVVFAIRHLLLDDKQQEYFGTTAHLLDQKLRFIPLTFILGFFVKAVIERWNRIFHNMGFIDNCAFFASSYIRGTDKETRMIRRNIVRYLCLTQVMVLRDISIRVRKRFPTHDSLVESGYLQPHEQAIMESIGSDYTKYWVPVNWVFSLIYEMKARSQISSDTLVNGFCQEVRTYRNNLQTLCNYDWVPIPLAYPQVVGLAVRVYFLICLISRQHSEKGDDKTLLFYVPFMSMIQLIFYMGWLKVAEALLNPLGEDDDDFECNYIIDRNLAVGMSMVDSDTPTQLPDMFEEDALPLYSEETARLPVHPLIGSASRVARRKMGSVRMVPQEDDSLDGSRRHSALVIGGKKISGSLRELARRMSLPQKKSDQLELGDYENNESAPRKRSFVPDRPNFQRPLSTQTIAEEVSFDESSGSSEGSKEDTDDSPKPGKH